MRLIFVVALCFIAGCSGSKPKMPSAHTVASEFADKSQSFTIFHLFDVDDFKERFPHEYRSEKHYYDTQGIASFADTDVNQAIENGDVL